MESVRDKVGIMYSSLDMLWFRNYLSIKYEDIWDRITYNEICLHLRDRIVNQLREDIDNGKY
jgi:hypothetical protein